MVEAFRTALEEEVRRIYYVHLKKGIMLKLIKNRLRKMFNQQMKKAKKSEKESVNEGKFREAREKCIQQIETIRQKVKSDFENKAQ